MKVPSARRTFIVLAALLLPAMVVASYWFGVTWDEKSRHAQGQLVVDFFAGRLRRGDFRADDGSNLYGELFDVLCVYAERLIPLDRYVIRHGIDAIFGWVGIVYCGRLAGRLFGGWAGVLGLVLLAASPRYFAHSMNNPKDLPLAALTVVALYYISTVSSKWPYLSWKTTVAIGLAIALAMNVRAAALLYLGYFGLLVLAYIAAERQWNVRRLGVTALRVVAVVVIALVLGTVFWPWAQGNPFVRPVQAAIGLSDFPYGGGVLFMGQTYNASDLPWYYAPWWLLISTPPVVLIGLVLSLASWRRPDVWKRLTLWFVALLPVTLAAVRGSTLYDGIRHLLFVYPPLVVVAASGWSAWLSPACRIWTRRLSGGALAAALAAVLLFDVRAFPNLIAYFNPIVGGSRGAFARYEEDYWGNCVLQAVDWAAQVARLTRVPVGLSGNPDQVTALDVERYHELFFAPPMSVRHHLMVRLMRGPADGVTDLAGRGDILHTVAMPDGAPLCVVLPGPAYDRIKDRLVFPAR